MSNQALILSLKFKYPLVIRLATLFSIILLILTFLIYPRYLGLIELEDVELQEIIIENNENFIIINKPAGIAVQSGTKSFKNIIDILKNSKYFVNSVLSSSNPHS